MIVLRKCSHGRMHITLHLLCHFIILLTIIAQHHGHDCLMGPAPRAPPSALPARARAHGGPSVRQARVITWACLTAPAGQEVPEGLADGWHHELRHRHRQRTRTRESLEFTILQARYHYMSLPGCPGRPGGARGAGRRAAPAPAPAPLAPAAHADGRGLGARAALAPRQGALAALLGARAATRGAAQHGQAGAAGQPAAPGRGCVLSAHAHA